MKKKKKKKKKKEEEKGKTASSWSLFTLYQEINSFHRRVMRLAALESTTG